MQMQNQKQKQNKRKKGPKIRKRPLKTHTAAGVPLTPFAAKPIRLNENTKTDPNVTDTVKGCPGGCWGCYAALSMGVMYNRINFDIPVSQILDPGLLKADCVELMWKRPDLNWVRIGVMGDPSLDWELTTKTCEVISETGLIPVLISKFWKQPSHDQLVRMAISGAIMHWSVIPGYDDHPEVSVRSRTIFEILTEFHRMSRAENVLMRLCTFYWNRDVEDGATLADSQDWYAQEAERLNWRILETPWKLEGNDPRWPLVDRDLYDKAHSYADWSKDGRKRTAGAVYFTGDPYATNDTWAIGCVTPCGVCPNQCGTKTD
jgi:hypothetical protein